MRRCALAVLMLLAAAGACGSSAPPPTPPPAPDGARAFQHLEAQVACGPRVPGTPAAACCRRYILAHLERRAEKLGLQEFRLADPYGTDSLQLVNILAHFHPERPARVLLAAHYDSRPRADRDSGAAQSLPVPGANDGASGVAVLLEVAEALGSWDPGVGVDLVFFDGEDYGKEGEVQHYLLGSRHFAATMGAYRPRAMLLLDMVGDADLHIRMEENSLRAAPALTRLVFAVAESLGAKSFVSAPGPAVYDDHMHFLLQRIPAVDLIDLDYPAWHTTRDLPAACSPASLEEVARVVLHVLQRLGRGSGA